VTWGVGAGLAVEHWADPKLAPPGETVLLFPTTNVWTRVLVDFQQNGPVHKMHVEFWDLK